MTKRSKVVVYSDLFENIDIEIAAILRKCNNGKSFDALKCDKKEKLWNALFHFIKSISLEEINEDNIQNIKTCTELILHILNTSQSNFDNSKALIDVMGFLNCEEFLIKVPGLINSISKLNEYWMTKVQMKEKILGMEYTTLKHLLTLCTLDKSSGADVQRLSSIRKAMTATPFENAVPSLRPLLIKLVEMASVSGSEHGQRFIAQSLILSQKLMIDIHKTIMLDLSSCNKKKAANYAKIYIIAWHSASNEIKLSLEKSCFQNIMEAFLKEQRTSLELNKNSQNLLAVLEVWHSERKKKHPGFVTMITDAYQPILWKYLQSGFNMHRCNAADIFFKAFPLLRTDDNAIEAEKFFSMQFETMLANLTDDCHIVRIIAIREVCNIISHYWNSFNPAQIQSLLKVITKQNACDASTAEARRMVYIGLQSLVKSSLSCDYVKQILPFLSNNIHDVNQKVRIAFIQLLICIRDKKDPNFKYSDVVSMSHIQYRLADDNAVVGQWIVKLLMPNYYHSNLTVVEWTKRFIYLIKTYRKSYRNFFFYSSKSLSFEDACTIIYEILSQLGLFVLSKYEVDKEDENTLKTVDKKRSKKNPLSESNGRKESLSSETSSAKKCAFDDPDVVLGLFDIVTILWVLNDMKLNKPENEEIRFKLYDTYIKYAQPFINYYKDCSLFLGVISLSGNIPASLLRNNSITLPGYCIKMLKSLNLERSDEENEKIICMLMALVKWGRGSEIIEQVTLWLDAAFATQNMNETILPRKRVKISEVFQSNSVVAIHILNILLKKEYAKLKILKKNHRELFQLWKFMSRIRTLIENRLEQAEPFAEDLVSDEFLIICFRRYVKLIPLFREDGGKEEGENLSQNETDVETINHQKEIENVLEWGDNVLYPLLQNEALEEAQLKLITTILEDILYVSDNMIIIHLVNNAFHFKIGRFVLKLLSTKYGMHFIKASSRITVALNHSAKLLFNVSDDLKMFSTVIPSLVSHTLMTLSKREFSARDIEKLEEDLLSVKTNFSKILATYQDNLKSASGLKEKVRQLKLVVGLFVDCIIYFIVKEIPRKDSSIPLYSSPTSLPSIANTLVTLFYNKKTWTSLFLHLLSGKLSSKRESLKTTLACILLLHMYASGDKKANLKQLKKALISSSKKLTDLKNSINFYKESVDSSTTERNSDRKSVERNLPDKVQCSALESLSKSTETHEKTSKEEFYGNQSKQISDSIKLQSSQNNENNLEEDFVICGLELIKNIENILRSRSTDEADEDSS